MTDSTSASAPSHRTADSAGTTSPHVAISKDRANRAPYGAPTPGGPVLHLTGPLLLGRDREIPEAWVVDGRIRHSRPDLPADAEIVEVAGYVVPGLADLHCHIGISDEGEGTSLDEAREQARTDLATGVTLIRDAGSIIDTTALQSEPGLPRIIRAGRHISRTRRYLRGYAHEVEPAELPATVAQEAERGDGWVKIVGDWILRDDGDLAPTFDADAFREAADAAHEHGARITAHTFSEETLPLLLDAGFDCLEHATGLTDATIARAAEQDVPVITTLVNVGEFEQYAAQGERKFPEYASHMRHLREGRYARLRDALDAGVTLLVGTDAGGVLGHGIIHDELDELAAADLDPVEILEAASWAPREYLGVPALEDGDPADLIVTEHDPRRDHRALRDPARVVVDGAIIG